MDNIPEQVQKRIQNVTEEVFKRRDEFNTNLKGLAESYLKTNESSEIFSNETEIILLQLMNDLLSYLSEQEEVVLNTTFYYRNEAMAIKRIYNQTVSNGTDFSQHFQNYQNNKLEKLTYYDHKINLT